VGVVVNNPSVPRDSLLPTKPKKSPAPGRAPATRSGKRNGSAGQTAPRQSAGAASPPRASGGGEP
jgi:hypothetical protein